MGCFFDFAKFKANIILLFRFGASFFSAEGFFYVDLFPFYLKKSLKKS